MITRLLEWLWKLPPPRFAIERVQDQPVKMRDGATLLTDVYRPVGATQPGTVLMRSPYSRGSLFVPMARIFAGQGYNTVLQSVRGTFGSGGRFDPFFQERDDGVDTVAWIEQQPWYHGKLGLQGASYLGFVEWAIAAELGDRITAMSTAMTTSDFHAWIYAGGGFRLEDNLKWISGIASQERTSVLMRNVKERLFGDPIKEAYVGLPLGALDANATGREMDFWRRWLAHDDPADPFWRPIKNGEDMSKITAPVSMVGGWSDVFIPCQVRDFKAMRMLGKTTRLTLGPWTHSNFQGVGEGIRDALEWFDIHLNGRAHPPEALDRIRLWVQRADEWRDLQSWPSGSTRLHLGAGKVLTREPPGQGAFTFTYDPFAPTPSLEGAKLASRTGHGDTSELAARSDVLVFDGDRLEAPLELIGDVSFTLTTSADSPYHDLFVCLCDVAPDGKAINITDGYRRLTAASGEPTGRKTMIEALPTAWRLAAGHHLRLLVAGGAFPRYARNLGNGEPLATATEGRVVAITVHCDADASYLTI
jgi:putative CocE/NonD family hydrolase